MISSALESIDEGRKSLQSYPTIVHVTVLSAFVLPIAFLPYWAARRHIFALRQRVELLEIGTKHLREKLQVASSVQTLTKDELRHMQSKVQNTIKESHDWRALADQKEVNRTILDETTRTELLQEARRSRNTFHALGVSLADIAAFIEQVELDFGMPGRGKDGRVERMRTLALKISREHIDNT